MVILNDLKSENEILKRLLRDGHVLINYDSRDCDGCYKECVYRFNDLESIYKAIADSAECADGSFAYSLPLVLQDGSLELNESFTGGQW